MKMLCLIPLLFLASCLPSMKKGKLRFETPSARSPVQVEDENPTPTPAPDENTDDTDTFVGFDELKEKVLIPYDCLVCHKSMADENKVLSRLTPGDPANSKFYMALENGSMPKKDPNKPQVKGDPLTKQDLLLVRNYIRSLKPQAVTFEELKNKVLVPYQCIDCHKSMADETKLLKKVVPGRPDESSLFVSMKNGSMPKKDPRKPEIRGDQVISRDLEIVIRYIESVKPNP